jgi:hypothetical protein
MFLLLYVFVITGYIIVNGCIIYEINSEQNETITEKRMNDFKEFLDKN